MGKRGVRIPRHAPAPKGWLGESYERTRCHFDRREKSLSTTPPGCWGFLTSFEMAGMSWKWCFSHPEGEGLCV